MKHGIRWI